MKGKYPLNRAKLHRALLELLNSPQVTLRQTTMRAHAGHTAWDDIHPPSNIKIRVDANSGDPIEITIHELIHVVVYPMTLGHVDNTLDEVIVDALTSYVFAYVQKNPARMREWTTLIKRKLKESDDTVEVPYDQFVKRSNKD